MTVRTRTKFSQPQWAFLDVHRPGEEATALHGPASIHFHGGGFKTRQRAVMFPSIQKILELGYTAVNASYRIAPTGQPNDIDGQYADCVAAVAKLRDLAAMPIIAWGGSAGAHFVAHLAIDGLVDAAVCYSGPYSPTPRPAAAAPWVSWADLLPLVTPAGSPMLLVNSRNELIPPSQAEQLLAATQERGGRNVLYAPRPGRQHSMTYLESEWRLTREFLRRWMP